MNIDNVMVHLDEATTEENENQKEGHSARMSVANADKSETDTSEETSATTDDVRSTKKME